MLNKSFKAAFGLGKNLVWKHEIILKRYLIDVLLVYFGCVFFMKINFEYLWRQTKKDVLQKLCTLLSFNKHILHRSSSIKQLILSFRSSRPEVFCKGVLRNFTKFTGKHLCQSLFFNKVAGLRLIFAWTA